MSNSARFSLRVPTRLGGLDVDVRIEPHPAELRYSTGLTVVRVSATGSLEELGVGTFHRKGHIEWSLPMRAHSSLTATEMVESRVRSIIQTFLRFPPWALRERRLRRPSTH